MNDRSESGQQRSHLEAGHPLVEPSLFYDPPYERPLEDEFAWHLVKYLNPITGLLYQQKVATPCAACWVDFVVEHGPRRIGFECGDLDASAGSGPDEQEARFRDALVVGSGAVDVLYRLRGEDLVHRLHDVLLIVARLEPELFSARGLVNLQTLATPEARAFRPDPRLAALCVTYPEPVLPEEPDAAGFDWAPLDVPSELVVRRLDRTRPEVWLRDHDRALAHFGVSDDDLGARWARSA